MPIYKIDKYIGGIMSSLKITSATECQEAYYNIKYENNSNNYSESEIQKLEQKWKHKFKEWDKSFDVNDYDLDIDQGGDIAAVN